MTRTPTALPVARITAARLCFDGNAFAHADAKVLQHASTRDRVRTAVITIDGIGTFAGTVTVTAVESRWNDAPGVPPFDVAVTADMPELK